MDRPRTIGELRQSGYKVVGVKDEMRRNLIRKLRAGESLFPGILGYEETVIPEVCNAILSKHDMLFLGLRGQAKTRMLRQLVNFLDDAIPAIAGTPTNDNPFAPLSREGRDRVAALGDTCPIEWLGRERRYQEKLATPDVTIADLIGEIDMIKHAEGRYLSDELVLHYGLIPRSNRGIFALNELPDLSAKIQVGLFNVLEERDVQIRGFPIRLELDVCLVFSANPEDYTNRGRIVTPLKDRIGSVVRTHYPLTRSVGVAITEANAWLTRDGTGVYVPGFMREIVEEVSRQARTNPAVNQQSGVSVRMSIANAENMVSNAERRALLLGETAAVPRICDLSGLAAGSRGKLELLLGEEEGQEDRLIARLLGEAIKVVFAERFEGKRFRQVVEWFENGGLFPVGDALPSGDYLQRLEKLPALRDEVEAYVSKHEGEAPLAAAAGLRASVAEWILEALHVNNRLNKHRKGSESQYRK